MPLAFIRFLRRRDRWGRPVDPGYGVDEGVDPGYGVDEGAGPDNELPGRPPGFWGGERPSWPGHPGHLPARPGRPVDPGYGVELPPVVEGGPPEYPDQGLPPTYPVRPGHGLPRPPHVWPRPPRPVDPGYGIDVPVSPEHPIYMPGAPDHELPLPPGAVWPPLPPDVTGKVMCFMWLVGIGYRWTVIDCDLKPSHPISPPSLVPGHPDQSLPPTPEPRRG